MSFEDDIKAEFEAEKPTKDVDIKLNGNLYTFRFTQMDGVDWTEASDRAPARPGVMLDTHYGFNLRALVLIAAPQTGKRVDGDNIVDLTPDQWRALFKAVPGSTVARIGDALFELNVYAPEAEIGQLKKAFAAASETNSN